jgi:hypothetical protein
MFTLLQSEVWLSDMPRIKQTVDEVSGLEAMREIGASLEREAYAKGYRKHLIKKVEELWEIDEDFRAAIRAIKVHDKKKDKRGVKPLIDPKLAISLVRLGKKLDIPESELHTMLASVIDPIARGDALHDLSDSIKRLIARNQKGSSENT